MSFEQFPGFKVSPVDPSRELSPKIQGVFYKAPEPDPEESDDLDDDGDRECPHCEGYGYTDCFCGGDFCICRYHGEIPCFHCG